MSLFISSGYCFILALMILVVPMDWIIPILLAAFFHEICHYFAILLCAGKTAGIRVYAYAAQMDLPEIGRLRELLCALAGPAGGAFLCLLAPVWPRLALCAAVQSAYNLLPIYPLDGGRALRCLLCLLLPPACAEFSETFLNWLCIGALLLAGVYAFAVLHMGLAPILSVILLLFRAKGRKMPCKAAHLALQ